MQNSKIPKWLKATGKNFAARPPLEIYEKEANAREGWYDLSAIDTAHGKPSLRWRTYKKVKKRLAEMEELHDWIEKKGQKEAISGETKIDNFIDNLESTLNSMS